MSQLVLPLEMTIPRHNEPEDHFRQEILKIWAILGSFDNETAIARGRVLGQIKSRAEWKDDLGIFDTWLRLLDISKTKAMNYIELAVQADSMFAKGTLTSESLKNLSPKALEATARSKPQVQEIIGTNATQEPISCDKAKGLSADWDAQLSPILPERIKEQAKQHIVPTGLIGSFVRSLEKLPEGDQAAIVDGMTIDPDDLKKRKRDAEQIAKIRAKSQEIQALPDLNLDDVLAEASRAEAVKLTGDLLGTASSVEHLVIKLYEAQTRLRKLSTRLVQITGSSTPQLSGILEKIESLEQETIAVKISEDTVKVTLVRE